MIPQGGISHYFLNTKMSINRIDTDHCTVNYMAKMRAASKYAYFSNIVGEKNCPNSEYSLITRQNVFQDAYVTDKLLSHEESCE